LATIKKYSTIGCCGIDCGLCPRFYTRGDSICPGCGGLNFEKKHPSCGLLTCCLIKNGLEVCGECKDYPCNRFFSEKDSCDSFVTHKKIIPNLDFIKSNGIDTFIAQQKLRIEILVYFLDNCDDGRSKSFFCLSCALLPPDKLQDAFRFIDSQNDTMDLKTKSKLLKEKLQTIAEELKLDLKLKNTK